MQALFMAIFAAIVVVADQITKYLTVANIPLHGDVSFIPGFLGFTYHQNEGAAFSSFQGQQWLFAILFVALTVGIVWEYRKKALPFTTFERWCIAAVYAGGLGNTRWQVQSCAGCVALREYTQLSHTLRLYTR